MEPKQKKSFKERMLDINKKASQVYISMKSKKTPWYAKFFAFLTIAYALSPIDLIPDFIPILGYLDDLIILPLMIKLCISLIPYEVWQESELQAERIWENGKPKKWYYAIPIIILWGILLYFVISLLVN